ncbi:MAG: cytochrome c [Chloroflexota bacterium]
MRQTAAWLVPAAMLVALLAGGLFSTLAWTYQANNREAAPTVEPGFIPVPAVARPTVTNPAPTVAGAATVARPAATEPPAAFVANVDNGRQVYVRFCNACHPDGAAGAGPTLRGAQFKGKFAEDATLKSVIRDGQGTMPPFRQITDPDMNDLVAYIRTLD